MGNTQSYIAASLSVCFAYLVYADIYCSYKLLKTNVLKDEKLPSFVYLYIKYVTKALTQRTGYLHSAATKKSEVVYTVLNCRLETPPLRRFCSAAGYGWDYPDTEYRDIPLCFPEILCRRLLLMVLTDANFRLSPADLVRVRQTLKTLEPVDELKKGPFMLQVGVQEYRQIDAGVEVDICLSATSRSGSPVWESVLTLLSKNKLHKSSRCFRDSEHECLPDKPEPENVKQIDFRVPRNTGLQCVWSFSDYSPYRLLSLPTRLFGCRWHTAPSLWMLSVCLAEIEKHKVQQSKYMKKQGKGNTAASIPLSSPAGSSSVQVNYDYQSVAFRLYPGNGHAVENGSHSRRDQVSSRDGTGKMSSVPDIISNSQDQRFSMKEERNSTGMMDSSSQAYSGPEDNSTDPHEALTETSTLTFVDVHTMDESVENYSLQGVEMVYLKEFVLIDDDDDGDMSLREKTVTDLSVMDGKAADLVCGRLFSTSSGSVSECKDESLAPEAPPPEEVETAPEKKRCCFCTVL